MGNHWWRFTFVPGPSYEWRWNVRTSSSTGTFFDLDHTCRYIATRFGLIGEANRISIKTACGLPL